MVLPNQSRLVLEISVLHCLHNHFIYEKLHMCTYLFITSTLFICFWGGIRINIDKGCLWSNFLSYLLACSLVVVPLKTTDSDDATPSKVYVMQAARKIQIKRKHNLWEKDLWIYDTHENYYFLSLSLSFRFLIIYLKYNRTDYFRLFFVYML